MGTSRGFAVAAFATVCACGAAPSAEPDATGDAGDALADRVDAIMAPAFGADALDDLDRCVAGVAVVVGRDGVIVRGYGALTAGGSARPDGATLFQIGSISKVLTGLVLADEVEAGRLAVDQPASTLATAELAPPLAAASFTLGELISHRAGLPTMPSNLVDRDGDGRPDADADPLSPGAGYDRDHLRTALEAAPLDGHGPYLYSNLGVGLLGVLLEDHLGASDFDRLLAARLAPALGLTSTWGRASAIPASEGARLAQGYAVRAGQRVPGKLAEMGVLAAAGEAVTTGDDLVALLRALTGQVPTTLAPAIARALTPLGPGPTPAIELGYGFELERESDRVRVTKGGATPSYTAYLSLHRDPAVGAAVLTACGGFTRARELARALDDAAVAASP